MSFKGKKNVYLCAVCGHGFVSQDVDDGYTPFMTPCLACDAMATSLVYKIPQEILGKPAVQWYRPPENEWPNFSPGVQEHLREGGLVRRDRKQKRRRMVRH